MEYLTKKRPDLTASTKNTIMASFRNVLKTARDEGAIDVIPNTPRAKQREKPRSPTIILVDLFGGRSFCHCLIPL
jgi:hypothetical protein